MSIERTPVYFWGFYVCFNFGENDLEMRPWEYACTDRQMHRRITVL